MEVSEDDIPLRGASSEGQGEEEDEEDEEAAKIRDQMRADKRRERERERQVSTDHPPRGTNTYPSTSWPVRRHTVRRNHRADGASKCPA